MPTTLLYLGAGLIGLCFGSFLNVLILRDNERKTIMTGRSFCPRCRHTLEWYDLFPVLSFLFVGGKCRYCRKPISWQYPVVELLTAALALGVTWYGALMRDNIWLSVLLFCSFLFFITISVIDLRTMEIPIEYVICAGLLGAIGMVLARQITPTESLEGMLVGAGSIAFVLYGWLLLFKQRGMGEGDIWLAGAIGAVVGYPGVFVALMSAIFAGAIIGVLILSVSRKNLATAIPFGPFLCFGMLVALLWGQSILQWYILSS